VRKPLVHRTVELGFKKPRFLSFKKPLKPQKPYLCF